MKRLELKPKGIFPCSLEDCPPGFFVSGNGVGLKSEYRNAKGEIEAFCDSGEFYCGKGEVLPVEAVWIEEE